MTEMIYGPSLPVQRYSTTCLDCEKKLRHLRVPQQTKEFLSGTLDGEGGGVLCKLLSVTPHEKCATVKGFVRLVVGRQPTGGIRQDRDGSRSQSCSWISQGAMAQRTCSHVWHLGKFLPPEKIAELKLKVIEYLSTQGIHLQRTAEDRSDLPVDYRFLHLLLTASDDPEVGLGEFSRGVRVCPGARLPRLPAIYSAKKKWRLPGQEDPTDYLESIKEPGAEWRKNYSTLGPLLEEVEKVMNDQHARGQVLKLTEDKARAQFPGLVIASMGAQRKEKPGGVITARVLFDGSNGIYVNWRTRIRDQERSPIASDIKRLMREKSQLNQRSFSLTADVSEAHRQVPIHPDDWHMLGCRVRPEGAIYVNTVGTFGVASASYYWSRVAGAIGRIAQYCTGTQAITWHLLVADDYHLEASGSEYRAALMVFFVVCDTVGIPLSWHKTSHHRFAWGVIPDSSKVRDALRINVSFQWERCSYKQLWE